MTTVQKPGLAVLDPRDAVDLYWGLQKVRIQMGNKVGAYERADDTTRPVRLIRDILADTRALEKRLQDMLGFALVAHPAGTWLLGVPGVGPTIAGKLVGLIPMNSEEDFPRFSKLRVFAGICPGRNRPKKGEKLPYCGRLKVTGMVLLQTWLKLDAAGTLRGGKHIAEEYYIDIYHGWKSVYKEREEQKPEEERWSPLHCHLAAKNKMLDVFLSHLWLEWRAKCGWACPDLYVHGKLGHQMQYDRSRFSNPELGAKKLKRFQW